MNKATIVLAKTPFPIPVFIKNQTGNLLLGFILLCGLIQRIASLNDPISYDEAYTAVEYATRTWWAALSDYSLPNNHILNTLLARASTQLFGDQLWSLRFPALLAGLAIIPLSYLLGKALYSSKTGLVAAALTAWFPELVQVSDSARGYSLVGMFTMLGLLVAWDLLQDSPGRINWVFLGVCMTLGFWAVPVMLYPAGGIYLWLLLEGPKNLKFLFHLLLSGLLTGLLTILVYTPAIIISGWQRVLDNGFVQPVEAGKYFDWVLASRLKDTWSLWTADVPFVLIWILVAGFCLALILQWKIQPRRWPFLAGVLAWTVFLILVRRPEAFDRFWSWLLAPLLVVSAAGLIESTRLLGHKQLALTKILSGCAILGLAFSAGSSLTNIQYNWSKKGNPEAAATYLVSTIAPGDEVLVGYPNNPQVWYYLKKAGISENVWQADNNGRIYYILLATNQKDETLESILSSYRLDPAHFDISNAEKVAEFGKIAIFKCSQLP